MGLFGGTSQAATLNYDETCKLLCFQQEYQQNMYIFF